MTIEIRPVRDEELLAATRLTFPSLPPADRPAREIIADAKLQLGIDFRQQAVAVSDGRLLGSCLYVLTPGRGASVLPPALAADVAAAPGAGPDNLQRRLIELARRESQLRGALLIQTLLDDGPDQLLGGAFLAAGFEFLALLHYLELSIDEAREIPLDPSWQYETYSAARHQAFAALIEKTYQRSLDCPRLDRLRTTDDVIASHRAAGVFTPDGWLMARRDGRPAGLVLVNEVSGRPACELVYMGVDPEFRGQNLGRQLVQQAINVTRRQDRPLLTLAVDPQNSPALRIYAAAGFRKVAQRYAYFVPQENL